MRVHPAGPPVAFDSALDIVAIREASGSIFKLNWQRQALDPGEGCNTFVNYFYACEAYWASAG